MGAHEDNVDLENNRLNVLIDLFGQETSVELGLSEIGISNPHLVPSFGNVTDEFGVKYSAAHTGRFFKDTSINYNLEVDVDYRKEKGMQLTKKKVN